MSRMRIIVVLGCVLLVPAIAGAQTARAEDVQDAVDQVAIDPPDEPREEKEQTLIEPAIDRVDPVAMPGQEVDGTEGSRQSRRIDQARFGAMAVTAIAHVCEVSATYR